MNYDATMGRRAESVLMSMGDRRNLSMVMDMGEQLGISRQELGLLSRAGYSAWDMEDLLYDDALRACCLADARAELAAW